MEVALNLSVILGRIGVFSIRSFPICARAVCLHLPWFWFAHSTVVRSPAQAARVRQLPVFRALGILVPLCVVQFFTSCELSVTVTETR